MTMTPRAKAKNTARCAALALSLAVPIIATAIPSDAAAMAEDIPYGSKAESAHYETGRIDYQRNSQGTWVEKATDGSYRFEYVETGRDSDSVYIYDASRSLRLKLDFKTWMVSVSFNGAPYAESFKMTSIATLSEGRRPMPPASATTPANNNQQGFRPPYQQGNSQPGLGNLPRQGSTQQGYPAQGYPQQGNSQGNTQQTYRPQGYPAQGYPQQGNSQGNTQQTYRPQGYPAQGYPQQGNSAQGNQPVYPAPQPPAVAQTGNAAMIRFVSGVSGKCLEVDHGQTANNVQLVQLGCDGTDEQTFSLNDRGGGYFNIIAKHSGRCLDVPNGNISDDVPIYQYDCDGSNEQLFKERDLGGGYYNILTHSGKCFDLPGGNTGDYVGINQFRCDGSNEQKFSASQVAGQ